MLRGSGNRRLVNESVEEDAAAAAATAARYEGFCIDLLQQIADRVGFKYRIELVPDGKYGVFDLETAEWNGIVRQLMDKVWIFTKAVSMVDVLF